MDIQDFRIFARVAALQNLSAVGIELGLTAGTISKRLQALEDDLQVRLFDRTTRSIRITEEGQLFYVHTLRILAELDEARAAVELHAASPKGRIKLSSPASLGQFAIAEAVAQFIRAYPEVEVFVNVTDRPVNLQEEGFDVAIRQGDLPDSTMIAKRLSSDHYVLVAAPLYIARNGDPARPGELGLHTCLAGEDLPTWALTSAGGLETVRIGGRLRSNNTEFLYQAALAGEGIMRISRLRAETDIRSGRLRLVLPRYDVASEAAIWAVYPSAKFLLPRLRVLLDFLGEWFRTAAVSDRQSTFGGRLSISSHI
jgi:DNA-binding transcriptional LysR family regulator